VVGAGHEEAGGPSTDSGRPGGRSIRVLVRGGATRTFGDGQRLFSCRQRSFVFAVRAFHSRRGGCVRSSSEFTKSARTRRAVAVLAVVVAAIVAASSAGLYSELLAKLCEHTSEGGRDDRGVLYHMRNRHRSHIVAAVSSACLIARAAASGSQGRIVSSLSPGRPRADVGLSAVWSDLSAVSTTDQVGVYFSDGWRVYLCVLLEIFPNLPST